MTNFAPPTKAPDRDKVITCRVTADQKEALEKLAKKEGKTVSDLILLGLDMYDKAATRRGQRKKDEDQ